MRAIPEYCSQNDGECWTCSLENYGRDCMNNAIIDGDDFSYDEDYRNYDYPKIVRVFVSDCASGKGDIPAYCTQNEGACWTCSLVKFGRDCQNNPIGPAYDAQDDEESEVQL